MVIVILCLICCSSICPLLWVFFAKLLKDSICTNIVDEKWTLHKCIDLQFKNYVDTWSIFILCVFHLVLFFFNILCWFFEVGWGNFGENLLQIFGGTSVVEIKDVILNSHESYSQFLCWCNTLNVPISITKWLRETNLS